MNRFQLQRRMHRNYYPYPPIPHAPQHTTGPVNYQGYHPNPYNPINLPPAQGNVNYANPYPVSQGGSNKASYFENPLQHEEYNPYQQATYQHQQQYQQAPIANPYPKASFMAKPQGSGISSIMNSFKSQDGSFDFNKVMNTTGQMMNAVSQVSSMVKGLGGFFKV
jgi:hypothetical protein